MGQSERAGSTAAFITGCWLGKEAKKNYQNISKLDDK
jgi:hypothetical protein